MARNHGRILSSILVDPDFRTLSESAQRLYLILLAQPDLNTAGVLSINYKRWARVCTATSPEQIAEIAQELDRRRYVLLDDETEEAFVRSLIRNDGIAKQPQMLKNALRTATSLESSRLRMALADELRRLDRVDASETADLLDPPGRRPPPTGPNGHINGSPIQAHGSLPAGSAQPARTHASASAKTGGEGEGEGEGVISSPVRTSVGKPAQTRGDTTEVKTAQRITDAYVERQPMSKYPAVLGIVRRALKANHHPDLVQAALLRLAEEGRSVTVETLRIELEGQPPRSGHLRPVPAQPVLCSFEDLRAAAAAREAARLIRAPWIEPAQPPSDTTPPQRWLHDRAVEWIDEHEQEIRAALTERKTG